MSSTHAFIAWCDCFPCIVLAGSGVILGFLSQKRKATKDKNRTEKEQKATDFFGSAVEVTGHCDDLLWLVLDPAVDCQAEQLCQLSVLLAGPHPHAGI